MKEQIMKSSVFYYRESGEKKQNFTFEKKGLVYCLLRHPLLRPYHRLAVSVLLVNIMIFFYMKEGGVDSHFNITGKKLLYLTLTNFGVGIFIRQQQVVNRLFKLTTSVPKKWPLSIRWTLGKVYHFGGIHVGGFLSGSLWYSLFILASAQGTLSDLYVPSSVKIIGYLHLIVLVMIMYVSLPKFREINHNVFEKVARFGNWTSLFLFWGQSIQLIAFNSQNKNWIPEALAAPEVWVLIYLTFCTVRPWLRLKKIPVETLTPSDHVAISEFNYGVKPFAGSSTDLSWNPLFEWHSFANIPSPQKPGFRLCISKAGDWTGEYIKRKPKHIWVKGIPVAGVGNIELLFKKVIWVATGSGVGPCVPHLLDQKVPSMLVWSTKSPRETYGDEFVDEILHAQPNTRIWDTTQLGRPDLVDLALKAYADFEAEAVIVISNKKLTFHVNYELESRGIPCFGAIWDS